ncbi:DUF488 domain-containing protein [Thermus sp. PS18]|uniref:DUF488 domain-containing protein n=1 Tax=Thermus sp. PS18 TaxID=2849039 RepID=UPI0022647471|nr:DUF488 domain-containing protein [Thermus sp. PS18]
MKVYTMGYQRLDLYWAVREYLPRLGIRVIADVRERAYSWTEWTDENLQRATRGTGLLYRHYAHLGVPRPWRRALREGKLVWDEYLKLYREHLSTTARDDLRALGEMVQTQPTVLLCYEEDPYRCHRSALAEALVLAGWAAEVVHLRPVLDHPEET